MRNLIKTMIIGLFAATPAFSGGWEASRLDTSMMYNDDGYAEVGTSSITYDINGTTQAPASATHKMAKNQTKIPDWSEEAGKKLEIERRKILGHDELENRAKKRNQLLKSLRKVKIDSGEAVSYTHLTLPTKRIV